MLYSKGPNGYRSFSTTNSTTTERATGSALKTGGIRYNSSLVTWEGYNGTQWTGLGGGNRGQHLLLMVQF